MHKYSYVSISMQMPTTTTKKLLIGNLPDSTKTAAVENLFSVVGRVLSVNVVRNGFAFVEMSNTEEADRAIAGLNGADFQGRALNVNEARPKGEGGGGRGNGGGFGRQRREPRW